MEQDEKDPRVHYSKQHYGKPRPLAQKVRNAILEGTGANNIRAGLVPASKRGGLTGKGYINIMDNPPIVKPKPKKK